jgi:hypothetical protein
VDMVYGRSDDIGGVCVEGVARGASDDREGRQKMIHGGRYPSGWGEYGRNDLAFG